jgi:hypothetical protein
VLFRCLPAAGVTQSVQRLRCKLYGPWFECRYGQETPIPALGPHPLSYSIGTAVPSRGQSGRDVKLTTHPYLIPKLRTRGNIPLLPIWCPRSRVETWPKRSDFSGEKFHSMPSFGGEVKPSVPCRRFAACNRTLRFTWESE